MVDHRDVCVCVSCKCIVRVDNRVVCVCVMSV